MSEDNIVEYLKKLEEMVKNNPPTGPMMLYPHPEILEMLRVGGFTEENIKELFLGEGDGWEMWLEAMRGNDE